MIIQVWWQNNKIRMFFRNFPIFVITNHQPPTLDDNK